MGAGSFGTSGAVPFSAQKDNWSCGYHNQRMLLGSLRLLAATEEAKAAPGARIVPSAWLEKAAAAEPPGSSVPVLPSLEALSRVLESAWAEGFDPKGRDLLSGRVVGTRKWIGATECFTIFGYLGLRTAIVDFPGGHTKMVQWLASYFLRGDTTEAKARDMGGLWERGAAGLRLPVYLQHPGHSRTCVGVVVEEGQVALVVLDPAKPVSLRTLEPGAWKVLLPRPCPRFPNASCPTHRPFRSLPFRLIRCVIWPILCCIFSPLSCKIRARSWFERPSCKSTSSTSWSTSFRGNLPRRTSPTRRTPTDRCTLFGSE